MNQPTHKAGILIGSNIDPEQNINLALKKLVSRFPGLRISSVWESQAVGSDGPNFLNAAVLVETPLDARTLDQKVLKALEEQLGRTRQPDKNAPRTIDLDLVTWNDRPISDEIWRHAHAALPVAQLQPDLRQDATGERLAQAASRLARQAKIRKRENVLDARILWRNDLDLPPGHP
jgi:2-amino-4-hydroxy-6-hydroxymethyldihydropteridine diphosphokinase